MVFWFYCLVVSLSLFVCYVGLHFGSGVGVLALDGAIRVSIICVCIVLARGFWLVLLVCVTWCVWAFRV